ncbi:MAG: hypothetical protein GWN14_16725 [candidate division Zixibacteria bacterium]|nr:hypothetical protein [Gammaproteobacteria bacterium]NIX57514.1 hypothetical protein [candidate division Zixibacteria bacterium]
MSEAWYVLRSKPHKEFSLYAQLRAHEIECYFPRIKVKPVNPRSAKIKPYFPSYLFVKCDLDRLGSNTFKWMPYAQNIVSFDGEPAEIPPNIISGLKKKIGNVLAQDNKPSKTIKSGTPVIITEGPFEGYQGIFDSTLDENARVKVLLELIDHKRMPVQIDASLIQARKGR